MAITDWPEDLRPRERLIKHGPHALSDAELIAVFLRVGVAGKSAVDLGRDMLSQYVKPFWFLDQVVFREPAGFFSD